MQSFADVLQSRCSWKFCNIHRKTPCWSLFNKITGLNSFNFIKKRLQHRCFTVKYAKILRTPCFTEHLWWLLLLFHICWAQVLLCVTHTDLFTSKYLTWSCKWIICKRIPERTCWSVGMWLTHNIKFCTCDKSMPKYTLACVGTCKCDCTLFIDRDVLLTGIMLTDLQKAFNTINHEILFKKLKTINFYEGCIAWFQSIFPKIYFS